MPSEEESALLTEGPGPVRETGQRTVAGTSTVLPSESGEQVLSLQQLVHVRARRTCEGTARGPRRCPRSRHSSGGEETSRFEAGRFTSGSTVPRNPSQ